jgi:hypothetical protein
MCFSPEASFIASAGLTGIGVASARISDKKGQILTAVPFLFAIQQAAEGIQWLSIFQGSINMIAAYVFVFFAFMVWPTFVPAAVYALDTKNRRRLRMFLWVGLVVSFGFFFALLTSRLNVVHLHESIAYVLLDAPSWGTLGIALYLFATVGSLLASSISMVRWFGFAALISFAFAQVYYAVTFASVWCFIAAVLSGATYLYVRKYHRKIPSKIFNELGHGNSH